MEDYLSGKHSVLEALRSGRPIDKIWTAEQMRKSHQPIVAEAKRHGVLLQNADKNILDQMVGHNKHQGVVAKAAAYDYVDVEDILQAAQRSGQPPLLLLLDHLEDPGNLGSILRTAECTGVHGVIIPNRRAAGLTAAVSKASAGAVEYVPVARVANLARTIDMLKERNIWIAGADAAAEQEVYDFDATMPLAWIIGNENKGMARLIKQKCDFWVRLPMSGRIQSLNASVAAGVLMYETVRQRRGQ